MDEELMKLEKANVFSVCDKPDGKKILPTRFVFTEKIKNGEKVYKARYCAKGFKMEKGTDYSETWAPTASGKSLRILIALAAAEGRHLRSLDVSSAFLSAKIHEEIYVDLPVNHPLRNQKVGKLNYCLYGTKQSGHNWFKLMRQTLIELGLQPTKCDPCLFRGKIRGSMVRAGIHVDDFLVSYQNLSQIKYIIEKCSPFFQIRDEGRPSKFLGLEIRQANGGVTVTQTAYTNKILSQFGFQECNPTKTPMATAEPSSTDSKLGTTLREKGKLEAVIGSLIWLSINSLPDISYAVSKLA